LQLLQVYFTGPCNCYWIISLGLATAIGLFHWSLQLLLDNFTRPCNCYRFISQGIAIATGLISPGIALDTGAFHWPLTAFWGWWETHLFMDNLAYADLGWWLCTPTAANWGLQ